MAVGTGTEIRGTNPSMMEVKSISTTGGTTAETSPVTTSRVAGAVRGEAMVSPMTAATIRVEAPGVTATSSTAAAATEAAVRAGTMASLGDGGSGVLASRAHPGAVTALARPLGPIADEGTMRARIATSDRAVAQEGPLAL